MRFKIKPSKIIRVSRIEAQDYSFKIKDFRLWDIEKFLDGSFTSKFTNKDETFNLHFKKNQPYSFVEFNGE